MAGLRRIVTVVATVAFASGCDGATGADDQPSSSAGPANLDCIEASTSNSALRANIPRGFQIDDGARANLFDQVVQRDAEHGGFPARVAIGAIRPDDWEDDEPDWKVTQSSATAITDGFDTGDPAVEGSYAKARRTRATEVTYTAPNRANGGRHTVWSSVRRVGADRFTVTLVAPAGTSFEELKNAVEPTVAEGSCP